jgi:hypothetical protein
MVLVLLTRNGRAGVLVDAVDDFRNVPRSARKPAPQGATHVIWATADRVLVLSTDSLFNKENDG